MLTIPNVITLLRILFVPVFVMSVVYKRFDYSLIIFLAASLTDALDGLIARLKNQKSTLGAFLDPLADKLLLISAFLSLTFLEQIPKWVTIIIISRDFIVVLGWISLYIQTGSTKVSPSIAGKLSNIFQAICIATVLLALNFPIPHELLNPLFIFTAGLSTISCIHYIARDIKLYERTGDN